MYQGQCQPYAARDSLMSPEARSLFSTESAWRVCRNSTLTISMFANSISRRQQTCAVFRTRLCQTALSRLTHIIPAFPVKTTDPRGSHSNRIGITHARHNPSRRGLYNRGTPGPSPDRLVERYGDRYRHRSRRHVAGAGIDRHVCACQRLTDLESNNKGRPYIIVYRRPFDSAT